MKNKQNIILCSLLFSAFCFSSCTSTKKLFYIQEADVLFYAPHEIQESYELRIQPDDLLYILLNAKDSELLEPFGNTELLGSTGRMSNTQQTSGLRVDKQGNIQIPILGEFHVGGMTCNQLAKALKDKLISGEYIKSPVVTVQIKGFNVTVMGEVRSPGIQEVSGDRITLLDALSKAGDLLPTGKRENVLVVREENGIRQTHSIDLTSASDVFSSPCFYLRQNDLVYVEPNKSIGVRGSSTLPAFSATSGVISVIASIASLTMTILLFTKK
jgi:polysaccharide export outer membrane protein